MSRNRSQRESEDSSTRNIWEQEQTTNIWEQEQTTNIWEQEQTASIWDSINSQTNNTASRYSNGWPEERSDFHHRGPRGANSGRNRGRNDGRRQNNSRRRDQRGPRSQFNPEVRTESQRWFEEAPARREERDQRGPRSQFNTEVRTESQRWFEEASARREERDQRGPRSQFNPEGRAESWEMPEEAPVERENSQWESDGIFNFQDLKEISTEWAEMANSSPFENGVPQNRNKVINIRDPAANFRGNDRGNRRNNGRNRGGFRGDRGSFERNSGGFRGNRGSFERNSGGFGGDRDSFERNSEGFGGGRDSFVTNSGGFGGGRDSFETNRRGSGGDRGRIRENRGSYERNRGNQRGRGRDSFDSRSVRSSESSSTIEKIKLTRAAEIERERLPIYKERERILKEVEDTSTPMTFIQGETGSGKSTQVPILLLEKWPDARIVISQPRRLATISICRKVAKDLGVEVGELVGYHIRGEKNYGPKTQLVFMTSGMLIQELSGVDAASNTHLGWNYIVIDEVHERTLEIDFLLVVLKHFIIKKKFKLILMSATLNSVIKNYLSIGELNKLKDEIEQENENSDDEIEESKEPNQIRNIPRARGNIQEPHDIMQISDRLFNIKLIYLEDIINIIYQRELKPFGFYEEFVKEIFAKDASENPEEVHPIFIEIAFLIIMMIHEGHFVQEEVLGSFLVFLPGIAEINQMDDYITRMMPNSNLEIVKLHSSVPEELHHVIMEMPEEGKRRIILSTNITESSITLPDIFYVIDFGYAREKQYDSNTNTETLKLVWAAKSQMIQRAGRAGRVSHGICYRLMPENFYNASLYTYAKPEIQRCPIDKLLLKLKQLKFKSPRVILQRALAAPNAEDIARAEIYLQEMGALSASKDITSLGHLYANMPCDLKVTRLCVFGILFNCPYEAFVVAAILVTETPPIISFTKIPHLENKEQILAYSARLWMDHGHNSDLIAYMNSYLHWASKFGDSVRSEIRSRMHHSLRKIPVSEQEKKFCDEYYYDSNSMREIMGNFADLKHRFSDLGYSEFDSSHEWDNTETESLDPLRMAIAATFNGHYLLCKYQIEDDYNRNALIRKMGDDPVHSIMVPTVDESVTCKDVEGLLIHTIDQPYSVELLSNNIIVKYQNNIADRVLKMALWIGYYTNRYYYLNWVLFKKASYERGGYENLRNKAEMKKLLYKVPKENRREGCIARLDDSDNTFLVFLNKPLNPYRMKTIDLKTKYEIKITEESVNSILFNPNKEKVGISMLVATEYVSKRNLTLARNTTLMPIVPLMPQIITIIFSKEVEFIAANGRYDGFKQLGSVDEIYFDYQFTGKDVEEINEIRLSISNLLESVERFEEQHLNSGLFDRFLGLISKPRTKIERDLPNWRSVVECEPEDLSQKAQYIGDVNSRSGYLPPLVPLDIMENPVHWKANRDDLLEREQEFAERMKRNFLDMLGRRGDLAYSKETILACNICGREFAMASSVRESEFDPLVCEFYGTYGYADFKPKDFVFEEQQDLQDDIRDAYDPDEWVACENGHLVGWDERGISYTRKECPVIIVFPTMKIEQLLPKFWQNECKVLNEMSRVYTEKYEKELKIAKDCPICDEQFDNNEDFAKHVSLDEKHKERAEEFLKDYVS